MSIYSGLSKAAGKALPYWTLLILGHIKVHGRLPNLLRPKTMSEKILCRSLFDRRPIFATIVDKAEVRSYVAERLGSDVLTTLYHLTDDADSIPFDTLPAQFVVKPTHGSGWVRVVRDKSTLDRAELVATCKDWLHRSYYKEAFEPIYKDIKPRIMVEEYIDDGCGIVPADYKLFVFHGRVHVIEVPHPSAVVGCKPGEAGSALYTREWKRLPVKGVLASYCNKNARKESRWIDCNTPAPPHLASMLEAAEVLGQEWDFIRVDFYDTPKKFYFGEITLTPAAGRERFEPVEHDHRLGSLW